MSEFHDLIERYCPTIGRNVAGKVDGNAASWLCLEKGHCESNACYYYSEDEQEKQKEERTV